MEQLEQIVNSIIEKKPQTKADFETAKRQICSKLNISQVSNRRLLLVYQNLIKNQNLPENKNLLHLLKKAEIRTLSGVAIITSLTKPYGCPGNCIYCPTEKNMPKSYLANEPAAARAFGLKFDPFKQMFKRIEMLEKNGHNTDKIEFIVKGGTWNFYPLKYQYWFILESFRACNTKVKSQKSKVKSQQLKNWTIEKLQKELKKEQKKNENAKHRIVGLTLETRPDAITPETIYHLRELGCTRIELGLQAPDDKILKLVKRGHTTQQFRDAMLLLRQAGFKVDLHFMPSLPGTTPHHDVEMYKTLFSDSGLKPDMVKIYPCTVIESSELYNWYKQKKYKPYPEKKLFEAIIEMKLNTPRYCRISRLIRDIPNGDIKAGNSITNLRQNLKKEMEKRGLKCNCLRCREVGHVDIKTTCPDHTSGLKQLVPTTRRDKNSLSRPHVGINKPKLFIDKYETIGGDEYFLSFEDKDRTTVFAFLRLRLPEKINLPDVNKLYKLMPETKDCAFIRELHTYGQLISLKLENIETLKHKNLKTTCPDHTSGLKQNNEVQHQGWGKKLVIEAEKIAKKNNYKKISVISGVGVRGYYKKLGYKKIKTYLIKKI